MPFHLQPQRVNLGSGADELPEIIQLAALDGMRFVPGIAREDREREVNQ